MGWKREPSEEPMRIAVWVDKTDHPEVFAWLQSLTFGTISNEIRTLLEQLIHEGRLRKGCGLDQRINGRLPDENPTRPKRRMRQHAPRVPFTPPPPAPSRRPAPGQEGPRAQRAESAAPAVPEAPATAPSESPGATLPEPENTGPQVDASAEAPPGPGADETALFKNTIRDWEAQF